MHSELSPDRLSPNHWETQPRKENGEWACRNEADESKNEKISEQEYYNEQIQWGIHSIRVRQDGKLIIKPKSFYHVNDLPKFAQAKVLQEAKRQVEAATLAQYKIEWLVSDMKALIQLKDFFLKNEIDINITYLPE